MRPSPPPDRAERSGLDYLALGDWHGQRRIGPRLWYSGTPEADSFKHEARAAALLVEVAGPGAVPSVTPVPTGDYTWLSACRDFLPGEHPGDALTALLPNAAARRKTLFNLLATGRMSLAERSALTAAIAEVEDDFAWFDADLSRLGLHHDVTDLDRIDRAGALRRAAEVLLDEAQNADLNGEDRAIAEAALSLLYGIASEVA